MSGIIFDIRKHSLQDGPGIRTTFFLKGCPLSCSWCHNPESRRPDPELFLRPDRCLGLAECGACITVCPNQAAAPLNIPREPGDARPLCSICGACASVCPAEARQIIGRRITVKEVLALALEDEPFYDESGGGVTFSGGEPLSQPDFLLSCLAACKGAGIRTAVDTSGYAPRPVLEHTAKYADLFLFDLKHMDPREHQRWTGVSNEIILANLRVLMDLGSSVWIRIPLIPGINDGGENLAAVVKFLKDIAFSDSGAPGVSRSLQVLPYHDAAKNKYALRGLPYPLAGVEPPTDEKTMDAVRFFEDAGIPARMGG